MHEEPKTRLAHSPKVRIALLGPYHSPNLGDTAIQMSVIHNLRLRRPDVELIGVSLDARDTAGSLGIPAFPISGLGPEALRPERHAPGEHRLRWPSFLPRQLKPIARIALRAALVAAQPAALVRIARFLRSIDILMVSGGGQLDEFSGGPWMHPYRLQLWTRLARLWGARVAIVAVGLDRLESRISRAFVLGALQRADYRSFRDGGTLEGLRAIGWREDGRICPDLAFSISVQPAARGAPTHGPFAVISPISEDTWSAGKNNPLHAAYLGQLAGAAVWLHRNALRIRIVCSQFVMDGDAATRLAALLREQGVTAEICDAPTPAEFIGHVREAAVVVASRMHAAVLSLVAGAPVVAVAPLRKLSRLMHDAGLDEYCVELQSVSAERLIPLLAHVLEHESELRAHASRYAQHSRAALGQTYDDLVRLIDEARAWRHPRGSNCPRAARRGLRAARGRW